MLLDCRTHFNNLRLLLVMCFFFFLYFFIPFLSLIRNLVGNYQRPLWINSASNFALAECLALISWFLLVQRGHLLNVTLTPVFHLFIFQCTRSHSGLRIKKSYCFCSVPLRILWRHAVPCTLNAKITCSCLFLTEQFSPNFVFYSSSTLDRFLE